MEMRLLKPPRIRDPILFEVYFAKFFPVEELIAKRVMQRTKYGITLTKEFKRLLLEKMGQLGIDADMFEKFKRRLYSEISLGKLWLPIVSAVCSVRNCSCEVLNGRIYVAKACFNEANLWASAVYVWFRHVQQVQLKTKKKKTKTKGKYV